MNHQQKHTLDSTSQSRKFCKRLTPNSQTCTCSYWHRSSLTDGQSLNQGERVGGKSRALQRNTLLQSDHFIKFWWVQLSPHFLPPSWKIFCLLYWPPSIKNSQTGSNTYVSYLPLVTALFCQVTGLCFSFLLPFPLFSYTSLLLSLSSSGLEPSPHWWTSLPAGFVPWLHFPQKVTVVLSPPGFRLISRDI